MCEDGGECGKSFFALRGRGLRSFLPDGTREIHALITFPLLSFLLSPYLSPPPPLSSVILQLDAVTAEFNATYASRGLTAFHLSPGLVQTRAIPSAGLPLPLVLLHMLLMPLIARTIGNTPQSYKEIPVFVAANPKSRSLGLEFSDQKLRVVRPGWVAEEEEKRREVWETLVRMVEG